MSKCCKNSVDSFKLQYGGPQCVFSEDKQILIAKCTPQLSYLLYIAIITKLFSTDWYRECIIFDYLPTVSDTERKRTYFSDQLVQFSVTEITMHINKLSGSQRFCRHYLPGTGDSPGSTREFTLIVICNMLWKAFLWNICLLKWHLCQLSRLRTGFIMHGYSLFIV